jgi:hypothetical protein
MALGELANSHSLSLPTSMALGELLTSHLALGGPGGAIIYRSAANSVQEDRGATTFSENPP